MGGERVLIIQNDSTESLGLYQEHLIKRNVVLDTLHAYRMLKNDQFPSLHSYDAFIVGPTPISANDVMKHDYLAKEWEYLSRVIQSGKPCLGICCGGQILARIMGAKVVHSPRKEVGGYTVELTEDGVKDPLFQGFPVKFPVFHWHTDMFQIPEKGKKLVIGDVCPIQSFGVGNVKGVIFHLEITSDEATRWAKAYPEELIAVGKTHETVIEECLSNEPEMRRLSEKLVNNFIEMIPRKERS